MAATRLKPSTFFRDGEGGQRQSRGLGGQHTLGSHHAGHAAGPGVVGHYGSICPRGCGDQPSHRSPAGPGSSGHPLGIQQMLQGDVS